MQTKTLIALLPLTSLVLIVQALVVSFLIIENSRLKFTIESNQERLQSLQKLEDYLVAKDEDLQAFERKLDDSEFELNAAKRQISQMRSRAAKGEDAGIGYFEPLTLPEPVRSGDDE